MNRDQWESLARYAVKAVGSSLVTAGYVNGSGVETLAGAAAILVGMVWAQYHHSDLRAGASETPASAPVQP